MRIGKKNVPKWRAAVFSSIENVMSQESTFSGGVLMNERTFTCNIVGMFGVLPVDLSQLDPSTNRNGAQAGESTAAAGGATHAVRFQKVREVRPKAWCKWTEGEDAELLEHLETGLSIAEIADLLQRTERAIWMRLEKLGQLAGHMRGPTRNTSE
jgi:hypothetical protein